MSENFAGSCLCTAVQYKTSAGFEMTGNCHCSTCKKITGGPFESFAIINEAFFKFRQGVDQLITYPISEKAEKVFCGKCGTPIFNKHVTLPGKLIVHIGSLDDPSSISPVFNLHCENMLPWVSSIGEMKNFERNYEREQPRQDNHRNISFDFYRRQPFRER